MSNEFETDPLTRGIAAARAGDNEEARRLLRRVTEEAPDNVEAWVWRASVAENPADKKAFLEEALTLDPDHIEAKLALRKVIELEGERAARVSEDEPLRCTIHPDRETMLRCNRCGRAMCTDCAVRHPVGLRCRECVSETRSPIYQVDMPTAVRALAVALVIGVPVGALALIFGPLIFGLGIFFGAIIGFALGGAIGRGIAGAVMRAVPRKRGRTVQVAVGAGILVGLLIAGTGLFVILGAFPNLLLAGLYLVTAIPAAVATLR